MSIPKFDRMRKCMAPVWQEPEHQKDILWAGIFGSVSRNRAHEQSDVDILIVLKEHERTGEPVDLHEKLAEVCGREISLMCIWQGPDWAWGHVRVEALLSSRTVYGNREDVAHLRRDSMSFLEDGLRRLDLITEAIEKINNQIAATKTYENFIHPSQQSARQECVQELEKIIDSLDIQPRHHPLRTMFLEYAFDHADTIRARMHKDQQDITARLRPFWEMLWKILQPTSSVMHAFRRCATGDRAYIHHILASKRLADRFEEGGQVDDDMYDEILR